MGEAKRLRRLNEDDERYKLSIVRLHEKCKKSGFNRKITTEWITKVMDYKCVWSNETKEKGTKADGKDQKLPWATSFGKILKLGKKEKNLVPDAMVTYRRPPTLGNLLAKYKSVAMDNGTPSNNDKRSSGCQRCGLCRNYGKLKSMVENTDEINTKEGKILKLKQHLTCRDFGIYSAQCITCGDIYVGQTCTTYSKRWNAHRQEWTKMINGGKVQNKTDENSDKQVLFNHYLKLHGNLITDNLNLWDAYRITFAERPSSKKDLDIAENFWIEATDARINKAKTLLPKFK